MPSSGHHLHQSRASSQAEHHRQERNKSSPSPKPPHRVSSSTPATPSSQHKPLHDEVDDKASIASRSSHASQHPHAIEALRAIAGERVRHAKCAPEFLETIAQRDDHQQVKFIAGAEASTFFVQYLGEQGRDSTSSRNHTNHEETRPIVFAVTVWDLGRKCVDYYMTWRGKSSKELKEEKITALDDAFRLVARRIDKDYKKMKRAASTPSSTSSDRTSRKRDRSRSPAASKKSRPAEISVPLPKAELPPPAANPLPPIPEPPVSATCSVISLPYLNMVRGVPRGNRLALMVTNPDRLSISSSVDLPLAVPAEADDGANGGGSPPVIAVTPPDTKTPNHNSTEFEPSGLTPIMRSSASIYSTESRSSRSSRSSQSDSNHSPTQKEEALPPVEPVEFLIVVLGDKLEKEGLSWHGLERQTSVRSQHRTFTSERKSPWIGPLARADAKTHSPHSRKARKAATAGDDSDSDASFDEGGWRDSPVIPLNPLLESMGFIPPPASDHAGSVYHTTPVIPHLTMGYAPMLPPGSMVGSPAPANSQQLRYSTYSVAGVAAAAAASMASPRMGQGSQYIPAWMSQAGSAGGSPASSRPPSRPLSAMTMAYAGSPYMRPAY